MRRREWLDGGEAKAEKPKQKAEIWRAETGRSRPQPRASDFSLGFLLSAFAISAFSAALHHSTNLYQLRLIKVI